MKNKQKLVIIGAGEFQNPLILKAKEMGYETHVFAWKNGDIGETNADYFYPISIVDKEEIYEKCKKIQPVGVTSIGSDLATITVNYVARNLGLTCNPIENDLHSTNKFLMRTEMKRAGVRVPVFMLIDEKTTIQDLKKISYPVIVKPTDRSGSRAISKVCDESELDIAIKKAINESFEKKAICEEVIEGEEYSCECISYEGEHHILAFTKKYTTGDPHYIETGHVEPALLSQEEIIDAEQEIFKALDALNVKFGASHSEFKISNDGKVRIIEIGARMGGDCIGSDLVYESTGYDFLKMVIDIACGKKLILEKKNRNENAFIRFIFKQEDQKILEECLENPLIKCVRKEIKQIEMRDVTDSSNRFGYYIMKCQDRDIVEKFFRQFN